MDIKNAITVVVDTDSETPVLISKPNIIEKPETLEELSKMLLMDLETLCIGLCEIIHVSHNEGFFDGVPQIDRCIEVLENYKQEIKE